MAPDKNSREGIVDIGHRLASAGMISGTDGNISVRIDHDKILVTPSGARKGELVESDIVLANLEGHTGDNNNPSSEFKMHSAVYRKRVDIMACVHSHAPFATALAVAGIEPEEDILPEVTVFVGAIRLTEYAQPGTDEIPLSLEPYLADTNAFLLKNHGLLTLGRTLDEAWNRHQTVEHFARIYTYARQLGNIDRIPPEKFEELKQMAIDLHNK